MNLERELLERELKDALRRQDPPEGFAERVIGLAPPGAIEFRQRRTPQKSGWAWALAAAAAVVLALTASAEYRQLQQRRAAEEAVQALQIVADELSMAQIEVLNK